MSDTILRKALVRLKQPEKFDRYFEYLTNEWLQSRDDLILAVKDEQAWSDLKLPARLKLEIKNVIEEEGPAKEEASSTVPGADEQGWVLYYSEEHGAYYYYSTITGESQWAESEAYEEPDNTYDNAPEGYYEPVPADNSQSAPDSTRVFSRPRSTQNATSQLQIQRTFFPEDDYDDDLKASGSSKVSHRALPSKQKDGKKKIGRKRSSPSQFTTSTVASSSKYSSSSSSSSSSEDDDSSQSSDDSQYYIISESKKHQGKLKVETYSMPKSASNSATTTPTPSIKSPVTSLPPKRIDNAGQFTNKLKNHLQLSEEDVLETRQNHRNVAPSAPPDNNIIDYDAFLQQYRKTTKVMGANNPEATTPVLTKRISRRDSYMGGDNLRDLQALTPRSNTQHSKKQYSEGEEDEESEEFVLHPTPYVDHTDVYKSLDEHEDIVFGANDMLLDLAMGMENGLESIPGLSSNRDISNSRKQVNPIAHKPALPEKKAPPLPSRGPPPPSKPSSGNSHHGGISGFFHKKAPIPLGLPNHIDSLPNHKPISPKSLLSSETQHLQNVKTLISMGFTDRASRFALEVSEGDIDEARTMLLESQGVGNESPVPVAQAIPSPPREPADYYVEESEEILAEPLEANDDEMAGKDKDKKAKKKGIQRMGIFRLFN